MYIYVYNGGSVVRFRVLVQNFTTTNPHHKYILPPEPGVNFTVFLGNSPFKTPDGSGPERVYV